MPFFIKMAGLIFIIVSTTLFGIELSLRLRHRTESLNWYVRAVAEIGEKIRYTSAELPRIIGNIYESQKHLQLNEPFGVTVCSKGLEKEDKRVVTEFFVGLGSGDTDEEIKRCAYYKNALEKQLSDAEKAVAEKSRLYKMLGFFGGVAIAIILI